MIKMLKSFFCIALIIYSTTFVNAIGSHKYSPCRQNEVLSSCANGGCVYRACSEIGKPIQCKTVGKKRCIPDCVCKDMYLRAENGTCIPADECPHTLKCSKSNEYFDLCPPGCPSRICGLTNNIVCPEILQVGDPRCPPPVCRCKVGFYRSNYGDCVTWNLCKPCGENEIPTPCFEAICERRKCSDLKELITRCRVVAPELCTKGCLCKEGYLRDENGICVPIDQCPAVCFGQNEVSACRDPCPQTCESINQKCKGRPNTINCVTECRCKDGFYRNTIGECIAKENCLKCTGPNEYFSCGAPGDNVCTTLSTQNQTSYPITNTACNPMCCCEEGYDRDCNNECIRAPIEQFPPSVVCGPDEVYTNCVNGGCGRWNCSQPGITCINIKEGGCKEGCHCKEGLLRADNGTCIPADQCPPICLGKNEVAGCKDPCPQTCESINQKCKTRPNRMTACKPECRCKDGFYRNKIGECISRENCLKCTGPNEYFSCGGFCDNVCATLQEQNQTNCPIQTFVCTPKCYCEEKYARDCNNICIPTAACPPPPDICGPDEVYTSCVNGGCGKWNCSQQGIICIDIPEEDCEEGCRCKEGLLRADDGTCIPADQCPLTCYGQNEILGCQDPCSPQTCESMGRKLTCSEIQPLICRLECRCINGYFRNKFGQCVLKEDCPRTCGPGEVYDVCPLSCPERCDVDTNLVVCKPDLKCKPGCRCADNYLRNKFGFCIPKEQCRNVKDDLMNRGPILFPKTSQT